MIKRFKDYIKESDGSGSGDASGGGVAYSTLSNTGGMGAIVAPQPSSTPGDVAGSTKGSGDLPAYDTGKKFDFFNKKKKKKKKKRKDHSELGEDYRHMYVTKFSDWKYYPEKKLNEKKVEVTGIGYDEDRNKIGNVEGLGNGILLNNYNVYKEDDKYYINEKINNKHMKHLKTFEAIFHGWDKLSDEELLKLYNKEYTKSSDVVKEVKKRGLDK